ncbi:hypothetical protein KL930_002646 [Ogataea haglerorum]|uniref:Uncharacterized protein n=1 Tax=Ogataea haglerorum TaxID=1937702 RepID=A0AAN6D7F9_9ASCO|nr:uncharacterized protein KL911_002053 [Ogataea haglerorum]KAG7696904.1 hypothetical protein KL915_002167 [Ogataea haglerorum]KAG7697406.1 hypothetical protein KL951_002768 [Ogataea haglerorum]KAG7707576.1 hypothetical protein KL914_002397 [Ogataea haglerorum]KAG7709612.1 hypothetical protein KL950_001831 [Ogataea haglerorum]KAG7729171.1 hypothetical protein KL933_001397 [Ogataea haglerorum]
MDRGGKRMPLSEITGKLSLNRRPARVLKPNQLMVRPSKNANRTINVASLTRSYVHKETQTRTKSSIDEITRQISLRHRSPAQRLSDKYTLWERSFGIRPAAFEGAIANRHGFALKRDFSAAEARRDRPRPSGGFGVFQARIQRQAQGERSRASRVRILRYLV